MRRLNSNLSDKFNENWKTPYLDIIAVGTIQFFLSVLILCYGVFLMQFILKDFYDLKTSLWTAIAFGAAFKITNPWAKSYCKYLDNIRYKVHKRNIISAVFFLFGNLIIVYFFNTPNINTIFYGTFGGILSSIIRVHLKFATAESFNVNPQIFDIIDEIMKPLCLIFMPHLILFLTNLYGIAQSQLVIAGLILNIIPACLLVRTKKYKKLGLCKFQTIDRLSIEMSDIKPKSPVIKEPSSSSSEEEDDDDDEIDESGICQSEPGLDHESSTNVQKYFQNVGVKILQKIPEESETEEDDINEISSKRLSRISAILQELNENTDRIINLSVNNLYQPDELVERVEQENEIEVFMDESSSRKNRCFSISSDAIYDWSLRKRKLKSFLHKNFVRSFPTTLTSLYFYPALISNCIITLLSVIIFASAPYIVFSRNQQKMEEDKPNEPEEATFFLTIIGFTWLFFLAGYPVFNTLTSLKTRILFLVGLSISGLSLFIFHEFSYDNFTLFSLTFGLGHGIISYTENIAHEDFFGTERWKMLHGALEISTGCIVILTYLIIYLSYLEIDVFLSYAYWLYVFNVSLWTIAYFVKMIITRVRNVRRYNCQRYPNFDF